LGQHDQTTTPNKVQKSPPLNVKSYTLGHLSPTRCALIIRWVKTIGLILMA
jgi:hypothetical protein